MPYSEYQKKYSIEYAKNKYKRIPLDVPIAQYDQIKSHSQERSETVNGFIKRAINETMERDNSQS